MYESEARWAEVDNYFIDRLVYEDDALTVARASSIGTVMPLADVSPNQGAFLSVIAQIAGARRVLEFGTLAGYSTIWLARAVGPQGKVVTFEIDEPTAAIARANFERAGVTDRTELVVGPAAESVNHLVANRVEPFDLIFIDADKPNNPRYLEASLKLSHAGTVIIGDNVVRNGAVADANSIDPRVQGTWALIEMLGGDDRIRNGHPDRRPQRLGRIHHRSRPKRRPVVVVKVRAAVVNNDPMPSGLAQVGSPFVTA